MKELESFPIIDKIPKKLRGPFYTFAAGGISIVGVISSGCFDGKKSSKSTPVIEPSATWTNKKPVIPSPTISIRKTEVPTKTPAPTVTPLPKVIIEANGDHFLRSPFPESEAENLKLIQGFYYNFGNGAFHGGIDYINGDVGNVYSWKTFDILVAADGLACVDPEHHQGKSVFIEHDLSDGKTFYTYYGHLRPDSVDTSIPECSTKTKKVLKKGQKIAEAGSDGVSNSTCQPAEKCVHLHFEVKNGSNQSVDPYGIDSTAVDYPNPAFDNGKKCKDPYLWISCERPGEYALVLDGLGDGLQIEPSQSLKFSTGLTIEAEIEQNTGKDTDRGDAILARGLSAEPFVLWASSYKCNGQMATYFHRNAWPCSGKVLEKEKRIKVAMTYDSSQIAFYVDGQEITRQNYAGGIKDVNEPIFIGKSPFGEKEDFRGKIYKVILWNKARSVSEVNNDLNGLIDVNSAQNEGLVGYWRFNGNFDDLSGFHNDGKVLEDAHLERLTR